MSIPRYLLTSALVLAGAAGAFAGEDLSRDLPLVQLTGYNAGLAAQGKIKVSIRVDRADVTYAIGEYVHIYVKPSADAYLMVVDIGPKGKVYQVFPNAAQPDNFVRANQEIEIPSPTSGLAIQVSPPTGKEVIKVVAASQAAKAILPDLQPAAKNPFPELPGGAQALTRLLDIIPVDPKPAPANPPADQYSGAAAPAAQPAPQYAPPANAAAGAAPAGGYASSASGDAGNGQYAPPAPASQAAYAAATKDDVTVANIIIRSIKKR